MCDKSNGGGRGLQQAVRDLINDLPIYGRPPLPCTLHPTPSTLNPELLNP